MRSRPRPALTILLPLFLLGPGSLWPADGAASPGFSLVPRPQSLETDGRNAPMAERWHIVSGQEAEDSVAISLLTTEIKDAYGWEPLRSRHAGTRVIALRSTAAPTGTDSLDRQQGYRLDIAPGRITVAAPTAQGRYYGVQTLRQLIRTTRGRALPCLKIRDAPSLAMRGVSEDISRGQLPTLVSMRATIRELGYYKLNTYHVYMEDVFAFGALARATDRRDRLTPQELALIATEARRHHVTLVPVLQTLGHQERLLALPAFQHLAEVPRSRSLLTWFTHLVSPMTGRTGTISDDAGESSAPSSLCPVDPKVRGFVRGLVDDIAASAPMPFLHCGGDEPVDVGKGRSKAEVARVGLGTVYADYYAHLNRAVRGRGRQMMLYSDVLLAHEDAMRKLPKDIVVVDWHYDPQSTFASLDTLQRGGFRVIASAGLWNWQSFYPAYGSAFENTRRAVRGAKRYGAWGALVASWGDGGAECLNAANWAGYAYLAACAWERDDPEEKAFLGAYAATAFGPVGEPVARVESVLGWADLATRPWHARVFARPPTVHPRSNDWLAAMATTRSRMREALGLLDAAEGRIVRNRYRLAVMRHAAERYLFLAEREIELDGIARSLQPPANDARAATAQPDAARRLQGCVERLERLRDDYESLWLQANRPDGLAALLARIRRQETALRELERSAMEGSLKEWRPGSSPGTES